MSHGIYHLSAPKLVRKTAMEFAGQFYEESRRHLPFKLGFTEKQFIREKWPEFVPAARSILAQMLQRPNVPQIMKDEIFDALTDGMELEDAKLPPALVLPPGVQFH